MTRTTAEQFSAEERAAQRDVSAKIVLRQPPGCFLRQLVQPCYVARPSRREEVGPINAPPTWVLPRRTATSAY